MFTLLIASIIAYLIGSLSSAIIVARCLNLPDPRLQGSRNPGATNMLRIGGKRAAAITLIGDAAKGFIPVLFTKIVLLDPTIVACVAFAAFLGHLFPLYFRFQGGKGVATLLGCLLALAWPVALAWMLAWLLVAAIFRYSSLAALIASVLAPVFIWLDTGSLPYLTAVTVMVVMLLIRHHENIQRLLAGTEKQIGKRKVSNQGC